MAPTSTIVVPVIPLSFERNKAKSQVKSGSITSTASHTSFSSDKSPSTAPERASKNQVEKGGVKVAVPLLIHIERFSIRRESASAGLPSKGIKALPESRQINNNLRVETQTKNGVAATLPLEAPKSHLRLDIVASADQSTGHVKRISISTAGSLHSLVFDNDGGAESDSRNSTHSGEEKKSGTCWVESEDETFVNTIEKLHEFLKVLPAVIQKKLIDFFCDMEGVDLGKLGKICLLQITIASLKHTWIFDVTVLGKAVFNTMGSQGQSIRGIFESKDVTTVWWDCRNDQNALFFHHQVALNPLSTIDLQLMEIATRAPGAIVGNKSRCARAGLGDVVGPEAVLSGVMTRKEADAWTSIKFAGKQYFKHNPLGYGVFELRPLPTIARQYAGQDTSLMPMLFEAYKKRIVYSEYPMELVKEETRKALHESCKETYQQNGFGKWLVPDPFMPAVYTEEDLVEETTEYWFNADGKKVKALWTSDFM